jgi:hypothetical protein
MPLSEDETARAVNRAADEVCKKKKDAEKVKKEACECAKLQCGKLNRVRRGGSGG